MSSESREDIITALENDNGSNPAHPKGYTFCSKFKAMASLLYQERENIIELKQKLAEARQTITQLELRIRSMNNERFREEHKVPINKVLVREEDGSFWLAEPEDVETDEQKIGA